MPDRFAPSYPSRPCPAAERRPARVPAACLALAAVGLLGAGCRSAARTRFPPADPALPFSEAVLVGDALHVAGHLGLDPATGRPPGDPAEEARLLLDGFVATLEAAGFTTRELVDVTVFCADVSLYDTFNAAYRERFDGGFPARAFVGSGPLLRGCRFEMKGLAVR